MKRWTVILVAVGWLLLIGLAVARAPSSSAPALADATVTPLIPGPYPTARVPNELTYYTKRCWPACHYDPSWLSEEPERLTEPFEEAVGSGWTWLNEDGGLWSLEEVSGALRIDAPGGSVRAPGGDLEGVKNVLVHAAPTKHFDVLTQVTLGAGDDFQKAGVFVELDDGSIISLGHGYCEQEDDPACVGDGVYFDALAAGGDYAGVALPVDTVCLMLRRAGNSYIGYYHVCEPGETEMPTHVGWTEVGRCYTPGATPERIGLAVGNGGPRGTEVSADFEVVTLVERK